MSQAESAVCCFENGFSCAQAVISTYGPDLGLDRELALRVGGAFGAGMARMGRTCGAVTGALMAIGLQHGKTEPQDDEAKERCYDLAREFVARFEARNGSIACNELLGYDVSIPEQMDQAREEGLFDTLCPGLVRDAAEILEVMIGIGEEAESVSGAVTLS
jgi:C_GCAxxG_C_C family probable redox protein